MKFKDIALVFVLSVIWTYAVFFVAYPNLFFNMFKTSSFIDELEHIRSVELGKTLERGSLMILFISLIDYVISATVDNIHKPKTNWQSNCCIICVIVFLGTQFILEKFVCFWPYLIFFSLTLVLKINTLTTFKTVKQL